MQLPKAEDGRPDSDTTLNQDIESKNRPHIDGEGGNIDEHDARLAVPDSWSKG
jgi:hypothetical protein